MWTRRGGQRGRASYPDGKRSTVARRWEARRRARPACTPVWPPGQAARKAAGIGMASRKACPRARVARSAVTPHELRHGRLAALESTTSSRAVPPSSVGMRRARPRGGGWERAPVLAARRKWSRLPGHLRAAKASSPEYASPAQGA